MAYSFQSWILWIVVIVTILGIGLSRMVLGVHYPQDVIGGYIIGLVSLLVFIWLEPLVSRWLGAQPRSLQAVLAVGVPLVLIFLHPTDTEGRYPVAASITPMATIAGFGLGLIMERAMVGFGVEGEWWRRILRFVLGFAIVMVFSLGPQWLLPEDMAHGLESVVRFLRYALVGWAVSFLCPWVFVRLKLAKRGDDS